MHSKTFCAKATTSTMDMGLEFDYITSAGAGTVLGAFGNWPAIILSPISCEQWKPILQKVRNKTLNIDDLEGTDLEHLAKEIEEAHGNQSNDLNDVFAGLDVLPETITAPFFCLYDLYAWSGTAEFFQIESDLRNAVLSKVLWC